MPLSFAHLDPGARFGAGAVLKAVTWTFCLGLILISWLVALQQIRFERDRAVEDGIAQNVNRVVAFEQYVRRTLEVASLVTRYIADRFQRGEAGPELLGTAERPAVFRGNLARTGTFLGIAIVNAEGNLVATSRPGGRPLNVAQNEAFRVHVARDSGALFVGRPFFAPSLGRDVILLTRRLNRSDGGFAGVVSLIIAPEQFTAFYRDARFGPYDIISLIGLDGIARARRVGDVTSSGEDMRGLPVMRVQAQNPNGTSLGPSPRDGLVRYFSHRRLEGYPLFATSGVLESEILALPRRRARTLIAAVVLGTLATLGFAIVVTVLITRGEQRAREMIAANERLEEAQLIGEMGDWRYNVKTRETYWSPQVYALHERDPALGPIPQEEFRDMLDDDGRAAIDQAVAAAFKTRETQTFELRANLPSGTETDFHVVGIPLLDDKGEVTGLRGTIQNISGRKLIERLQTRLAHLSRLDAMNAMAATLAHELNQPLAAAANYLSGSRRRLAALPSGADGAAEGLAAAEQQIQFAGDIIRRVREMVANQPRQLTDFSLATVLDDALSLIGSARGDERPTIRTWFASGSRRVHADRVQVQQVILNLLRNAVDATRGVEQPEIVVETRLDEAGMVEVAVSDNGRGFSQRSEDRFSPFASQSGGMGLGLSVSRTIVESHGGRIWTEDRPGGGAMVMFTLPAAADRAAPGATTTESGAGLAQ